MISPIGSGGSLHLRRRYAQRSIVTTRSIALQLASAAPLTSPSRSHMPAPAKPRCSSLSRIRLEDARRRPPASARSEAEDTDRSPATDQRSRAQPPIPTASAPQGAGLRPSLSIPFCHIPSPGHRAESLQISTRMSVRVQPLEMEEYVVSSRVQPWLGPRAA